MKKNKMTLIIIALIFLVAFTGYSQYQAERINRGLVAVSTGNGYFLSWRLWGDESISTGFNVYKGATRLNSSPITNATCYQDSSGGSGTYTVRAVVNGQEQASSENALVLSTNYLTIRLSTPSGGTTPDGVNYSYTSNDVSAGDLDGDGEYEVVVKWDPSNSKDNSQSGHTGNVFLDAYKLNGTRLWRIDLGVNIRAGAHYTQFMVYDLDGDGRAEVACKTADGTRAGNGTVIGSQGADYRNSSGYILSGPEFLTVFDGQTGAALSTVNYLPARGNVNDWGDNYGNRVDRFLACIAYLDGTRPSLVMCRGYYTRSVLVAWDFRNGSLTHRWTFDSNNGYRSYENQGNHQLSVQDVDSDGRDEIIYGSCAIDDNGNGLWNAGLYHGDALHVTDIDTGRPGLEVWGIHEGTGTPGSALLDARTGQILWQTGNSDVGRGVSADLTSAPGMECWGGTSDLRTATNGSAGGVPSSANHLVWWDGDLYRELLDGNTISKYGGGTLLSASGCSSNNGTKSNPGLTADLLGDWREEVVWRAGSDLRIYTTTTSTNNRFHTLMHDRGYRLAVAWQNVAYNQPPHPGFFLGQGMGTAPQPNIYYAGGTSTAAPTNPPTETPAPTAPPPVLQPGVLTTFQAEDVYYYDAVFEDLNAGFTGTGYVNYTNQAGGYSEWAVNVAGASEALCVFTYANGSANARPVDISVNGNTVLSNYNCPGTSDWTLWTSFNVTVNLNSGINTIRLTGVGSEGGPNIDKMDITVTTSGPTDPPTGMLGDVNDDGVINIIDALLTAQYYVDLDPEDFDPAYADVDCDDTINIVDALLMAQYYVDLISGFCLII